MDDVAKLRAAVDDLQNRLREEVQIRQELERRCHLLHKLAHRDPSSGLRTETYLRSRVQEEIERSIRYPSATSLVTVAAPQASNDSVPHLGRRLMEELRATDHVFSLSGGGLAFLLVETPEEGARHVLERLATDLEQFISGYGFTVTTFPVDTNLADEFLKMAMERHDQVAEQVHPGGQGHTPQPPVNMH
jgi:PleD family two-component response regulator